MEQNRWKSKVLWVAVIAQIVALLGMFGAYDAIGITADWLQGVLTGVLELLVLFGVVNNPANKTGF